MDTCTNPNCRQNNLRINLGYFARDERLPMVERVLGLLVESRYGLDRKADLLPEFGNEYPTIQVVSLDLSPKLFPIPFLSRNSSLFSSIDRTQDSPRQGGRRARPRDLSTGIRLQMPPSNLGRGSPPDQKSWGKPAFLTACC